MPCDPVRNEQLIVIFTHFQHTASTLCRVDYRPKVKPHVCAICSWIILPECSRRNIFRIFPGSRFLTRASLFSITINFRAIDNTIIFRCVVKRGEARRRRRNGALNIEKQGSAAIVIFWQTSSYCCWPFSIKCIKKNATTLEPNPWELLACVHETLGKNVLISSSYIVVKIFEVFSFVSCLILRFFLHDSFSTAATRLAIVRCVCYFIQFIHSFMSACVRLS